MPNSIKHYVIPPNIEKKISKLPEHVREKFFWSLEMLIKNPSDPGLRHGKITGSPYWEFSITMHYRATYRREDDIIVIVNVGKHKDVL